MATKIGGDQLRLEDFIENPSPEGNWDSTTKTASKAAIKALMSASGIQELSGNVRLWEKEPGIYFLHGGTMIYTGASRAIGESYDSILILSDFLKGYNYKYYIIYNTIGQITCGETRENGGSSIFSNITPFQGASQQYRGEIGTVPAPQAGDNEKFLKGDGTWSDRIEHITGEVNIWELNDGIYLFDEGFAINATNTQHYSPGEKGYISILQNPKYEYEKNYYAVTAGGFMTYGVTSEYIGSINQAMLQTLSGSISEIGRGCLVPGKTNNETYYTLKGLGWTPGIISLLPEQYAYTWDKIQLKRVLRNGPTTLFNCSEQYIKDFLLKGGKVIVWSRTESDETYRMYEADNENGTIQEGNVVLRNISYQNGKLVVSEFRAQTSGQTEYWQLTQHEI